MLAILALISAASHMYNLNGIKSKTVGDGQHGAARFATGQELLRTFKKVPYNPDYWRELGPQSTELKLPQGVVVGCRNKSSQDGSGLSVSASKPSHWWILPMFTR